MEKILQTGDFTNTNKVMAALVCERRVRGLREASRSG